MCVWVCVWVCVYVCGHTAHWCGHYLVNVYGDLDAHTDTNMDIDIEVDVDMDDDVCVGVCCSAGFVDTRSHLVQVSGVLSFVTRVIHAVRVLVYAILCLCGCMCSIVHVCLFVAARISWKPTPPSITNR